MSTETPGLAALVDRDPQLASRVPALTFRERTLSYDDLRREVAALAAALHAEGVRPGDAVGLPLPNTLETVVALYAAWWLGAVAVPMNHTQTARELQFAMEDADIVLALTTVDLLERVDQALHTGRVFAVGTDAASSGRSLPAAETPPSRASVAPDHPAVVIFTSGTTGRPKGAVLSHGALADANAAIGRALKGKAGPYELVDRMRPPTLIALPLAHTGGLCSLLFAHYAGRHAVVLERFRIEPFMAAIHKHGVDTVVATPTMLQMLANEPNEVDLGRVRIVQSTGAPLPPAVKARFEERFRMPVIQNYGQTESLHVAGWTRDDLVNGTWRAGSVGRPYEGVELRVADDDDADVPVGSVGEILVRSQHTMSAYIGKATSADRTIDAEGWLHTGDLGYVDADGYLYIVDRKREVIIVGGFNVYPAEVENVLLEHPAVSEAIVVAVPDERLGEIPHAFVVLAPGVSVTEQELIDHCRANLAHYKAVRRVTFVGELPQTHSQKIKRQQVREMALSRQQETA